MAIFSGPEIPNNGLVFHYDMGNTVKSWKGAPTTNVIAANFDSTFDTLADGNTAGFNNQLGTGNYLGVSSTRGYQSSKSLKINNGTGGTARVYRVYPVSLGEYSSVSAWVYSAVPGPFITIEYSGGDYNWTVGQTRNTHTGTGWELLWTRANSATTSATSGHFFLYPGVDNTDTYWDNIQVEKQQYPTPYINGTRSNTQAIVDLTGNNTVTASSLTYASNGTFSFNGTSGKITTATLPYQFLTTGFTVSIIFKYTQTTTNDNVISWGSSAFNTTSYAWELRLRGGGNVEFSPGIGPGGSGVPARTSYGQSPALSGRDVVIDVTYVANGVSSIYENGVLKATNNYSGVGTSTATNLLTIGQGSDTYFPGSIYSTKVYNRALSAAEIQQNFESARGRYGI